MILVMFVCWAVAALARAVGRVAAWVRPRPPGLALVTEDVAEPEPESRTPAA
ncbi:hypothetical protein PO878_00615 [Iamia majanohamensis]|uniref:Uncharacterized protein n=1 Tax=Iamia majanohamensis TaxID=467976 RepID=A0AAF0BVN2_9ACTN|nr:hypothetical protein [Iamia majanohamensis]WCO67223.1 hypothetical protein PO878_00615 [Iamia majanohamensis]